MIRILRENNNELKTIPIECVKGATLLSVEEAKNLLTQEERKCTYQGNPCWWWLRSPGRLQRAAVSVNYVGFVLYGGYSVAKSNGCIRPALILNLNSSNLQIGDTFKFGGYMFKVISNEYALCREAIDNHAFRKNYKAKDADVYEKSDIKRFVDNWFNKCLQDTKDIERGTRTDDMIEDENDLGF